MTALVYSAACLRGRTQRGAEKLYVTSADLAAHRHKTRGFFKGVASFHDINEYLLFLRFSFFLFAT